MGWGCEGQLWSGGNDVGSDLVKLHGFDEFVESGREQSPKDWSNPVDPMIAGETAAGDDFRAKGTSGIQATASIPDTPEAYVSALQQERNVRLTSSLR